MSFINPSLPPGLPSAEGGAYPPPGAGPFPRWSTPLPSDAIAAPAYGIGGYGNGGGLYGGSSSGSTGLGGFGGIMNGFMNMLSNALTMLGGMLGGSPPASNAPYEPNPQTPSQTYFANATASSTGDPHDALNATAANGTNVASKWDDMQSHPDLLHSDSFAGGYHISTTATAPQANGVTYNASATIVMDGGATDVTMKAGGGYSVMENGRSIALTPGQTTALGAHESVTLGTDGALTIADTNARGGSLDTTLTSNGPGVDITSNASHVNLGGYLVNHTDQSVDPGRVTPGPIEPGFGSSYGSNGVGYGGYGGINPFGSFTAQLGTSDASLPDIESLLQNGG